jgi:hypothetical protein
MGFNEICSAPTDMMHRRTPLPFRGRFLGLGTSVTIQTDSPTILRAAEAVGFLLQDDVEQESQLRWEIVSESPGTTPAKDWEGKVTVDNHSLFLSMGVRVRVSWPLVILACSAIPMGRGICLRSPATSGIVYKPSLRGVAGHEECSCA